MIFFNFFNILYHDFFSSTILWLLWLFSTYYTMTIFDISAKWAFKILTFTNVSHLQVLVSASTEVSSQFWVSHLDGTAVLPITAVDAEWRMKTGLNTPWSIWNLVCIIEVVIFYIHGIKSRPFHQQGQSPPMHAYGKCIGKNNSYDTQGLCVS